MLRSLYVMLDYHIAANDGECRDEFRIFSSTTKAGSSTTLLFRHASPMGKRKVLILPFRLGQARLGEKAASGALDLRTDSNQSAARIRHAHRTAARIRPETPRGSFEKHAGGAGISHSQRGRRGWKHQGFHCRGHSLGRSSRRYCLERASSSINPVVTRILPILVVGEQGGLGQSVTSGD